MPRIKFKTIRNRVNTLVNTDLSNLDFDGLAQDGKTSKAHAEILEMCRNLNKFERSLKAAEDDYVTSYASKRLNNIFGKLVDSCDGDVDKATEALALVVTNFTKEVKANKHDHVPDTPDTQNQTKVEEKDTNVENDSKIKESAKENNHNAT